MQENAEQTVYSHSQPHPPPPLSELGVKCTGPKLRTYPVERQYVWLMPRIALFLTEMELSKTKSFNHQLLLTYQHRSNRKKVQKWMIGVNRPLPPSIWSHISTPTIQCPHFPFCTMWSLYGVSVNVSHSASTGCSQLVYKSHHCAHVKPAIIQCTDCNTLAL